MVRAAAGTTSCALGLRCASRYVDTANLGPSPALGPFPVLARVCARYPCIHLSEPSLVILVCRLEAAAGSPLSVWPCWVHALGPADQPEPFPTTKQETPVPEEPAHPARQAGHLARPDADVCYGRPTAAQAGHAQVLTAAYRAHPERFVRIAPVPPKPPAASWINPHQEKEAATQ
jgi:hypothetical protein